MPSRHQGTGRRLIALIAALGRNRVIGDRGALPWHLPADLGRFKAVTMGRPVVMGQVTYESIGRPLPGRLNIVLSDDPTFRCAGCLVAHSLEEALAAAGDADEVFLIGGASVYRQGLPLAERMYLTYVQGEFPGDAHFPEFDAAEWRETEREEHAADAANRYACVFVTLDRVAPAPPVSTER